MRNESGGSSHDPRAQLAAPMWQRDPKITGQLCSACKGHSNPSFRKTVKYLLRTKFGDVLICKRCDGG